MEENNKGLEHAGKESQLQKDTEAAEVVSGLINVEVGKKMIEKPKRKKTGRRPGIRQTAAEEKTTNETTAHVKRDTEKENGGKEKTKGKEHLHEDDLPVYLL